jgi:TRAP-type C4-dicarboxylate transport system permease small subunit
MRQANRFSRFSPVLVVPLGIATGLFLFAMMAVTTIDVIGRYFLSAPLPGAFELTQLLLAGTIFAGLPVVTFKEEHVTVTILTEKLPQRAQSAQQAASSLLGACGLGIVAWRLGAQAQRLGLYGDTTSLLRVPMSPLAWVMAALAALSSLIILGHCVCHARAAFGRPAEP